MQLIDYEQYLLSTHLVDPSKAGFYSRWVNRFLKLNLSDQLSDFDKIKQFSESIAVDTAIEEWQRKQAKHAVEIYLNLLRLKLSFLNRLHPVNDAKAQ